MKWLRYIPTAMKVAVIGGVFLLASAYVQRQKTPDIQPPDQIRMLSYLESSDPSLRINTIEKMLKMNSKNKTLKNFLNGELKKAKDDLDKEIRIANSRIKNLNNQINSNLEKDELGSTNSLRRDLLEAELEVKKMKQVAGEEDSRMFSWELILDTETASLGDVIVVQHARGVELCPGDGNPVNTNNCYVTFPESTTSIKVYGAQNVASFKKPILITDDNPEYQISCESRYKDTQLWCELGVHEARIVRPSEN